jgi:ATP dependent DNA ligase domain
MSRIVPLRLSRRAEPFNSDQFIFELKIDGFRALAHINAGNGELISRNGNTFHGFAHLAAWIANVFYRLTAYGRLDTVEIIATRMKTGNNSMTINPQMAGKHVKRMVNET